MSKVHRTQAAEAEEKERQRRIREEFINEAVQSEIDRRITWIMEERERRRRYSMLSRCHWVLT